MKRLSIYLSYLLRHHPEDIHLDMDVHGYVSVKQLIDHINQYSQYQIDKDILDNIVENDDKKRYKYSNNRLYIKACQGHSIEWVIPELTYKNPPDKLYHAVHTQADIHKAFQSAKRWHSIPVVLEIDAKKMNDEGYEFGVSDNNVWCVEKVPVKYILNVIEE
jgi:putative RNA 2'-phosphotransferase